MTTTVTLSEINRSGYESFGSATTTSAAATYALQVYYDPEAGAGQPAIVWIYPDEPVGAAAPRAWCIGALHREWRLMPQAAAGVPAAVLKWTRE